MNYERTAAAPLRKSFPPSWPVCSNSARATSTTTSRCWPPAPASHQPPATSHGERSSPSRVLQDPLFPAHSAMLNSQAENSSPQMTLVEELRAVPVFADLRSEEHTSELQS